MIEDEHISESAFQILEEVTIKEKDVKEIIKQLYKSIEAKKIGKEGI